MRRWHLAGLVIVVVYLATVSATIASRNDHVRPLYDGFAGPSPYEYVDPPAWFAPQNVKPTAMSKRIALGADGSAAAGIATPDGQFVINLGRGAIAPFKDATAISVRITPVDPHELAPVPGDGLRAAGNAYHLEITYEPGGRAITRFAKPGTMFMELPELAQHEFLSNDGHRWSSIPAQLLLPHQRSMTATLRVPGYYLAGTNLPAILGPSKHASRAALVIGLGVVLVALLMFLGIYLAKVEPKSKSKSRAKAESTSKSKAKSKPKPSSKPTKRLPGNAR